MFGLEVLSAESSLSILNMTSKVPKFQVVGLLSEKSFTLTLHSSNARGQSEKVNLRAETTKPATVTQTDINQAKIGSLKTRLIISPVLGVLIGVGGAIILVSIILFSIMCCRVKYEKISRTLMRRGETAAASDCGNSDKDFQEDLYVDLTGNSPDLIPAEAGSHNKKNTKTRNVGKNSISEFQCPMESKLSRLSSSRDAANNFSTLPNHHHFKRSADYETIKLIHTNINTIVSTE